MTRTYLTRARELLIVLIMITITVAGTAAFTGSVAAQPEADIAVADGPTPEPVAPGETVEVTLKATNTGDETASSSGIQITQTATDIEADSDGKFNFQPLAPGESFEKTFEFTVSDDIEEGEYNVTAEAAVGDSRSEIVVKIDVQADDPVNLTVIDQTSDPIEPGETTDITFALTNTGNRNALSGGINITETPSGIDPGSSAKFALNGINDSETFEATFSFEVADDVEDGQYAVNTQGSVGDIGQNSTTVNITVEQKNLDRFDQDGSGDIGFGDTIETIIAFNDKRAIDGSDVTFSDVIDVITEFNSGGTVVN